MDALPGVCGLIAATTSVVVADAVATKKETETLNNTHWYGVDEANLITGILFTCAVLFLGLCILVDRVYARDLQGEAPAITGVDSINSLGASIEEFAGTTEDAALFLDQSPLRLAERIEDIRAQVAVEEDRHCSAMKRIRETAESIYKRRAETMRSQLPSLQARVDTILELMDAKRANYDAQIEEMNRHHLFMVARLLEESDLHAQSHAEVSKGVETLTAMLKSIKDLMDCTSQLTVQMKQLSARQDRLSDDVSKGMRIVEDLLASKSMVDGKLANLEESYLDQLRCVKEARVRERQEDEEDYRAAEVALTGNPTPNILREADRIFSAGHSKIRALECEQEDMEKHASAQYSAWTQLGDEEIDLHRSIIEKLQSEDAALEARRRKVLAQPSSDNRIKLLELREISDERDGLLIKRRDEIYRHREARFELLDEEVKLAADIVGHREAIVPRWNALAATLHAEVDMYGFFLLTTENVSAISDPRVSPAKDRLRAQASECPAYRARQSLDTAKSNFSALESELPVRRHEIELEVDRLLEALTNQRLRERRAEEADEISIKREIELNQIQQERVNSALQKLEKLTKASIGRLDDPFDGSGCPRDLNVLEAVQASRDAENVRHTSALKAIRDRSYLYKKVAS
jgi:hypothetical protein